MKDVWSQYGLVVFAFAAALPAIVVAAVAVARVRQRRGVPAEVAWRTTVAEVAIVAGTAPWLFMGLMPNAGAERLVHLVPFVDLRDQWGAGIEFFTVQVTANLLVFATAGFFAPIRWPIGPGSVLIGAVVASTLLEVGQYVLNIGRVSSIDDVLVNAAGAWLAAWCSARWWLHRPVAVPA